MAFPSVLSSLSTSPLAWGQCGVTRRCVKPRYSANSLNSLLLKGGPLSVRTRQGIPNWAKILSRCGITVLFDVECMMSTTGYRE